VTAGTKRLHDSSVSRNLGTSVTPAAIRAVKPGWRDPRLWIGVAIVAVSVLVGAKLIGGAEQSVPVWSVTKTMPPGPLTSGDLVARKVRFVNAADADVYLSADQPLPEGTTLTRDLAAGELVPRSALGSNDTDQSTMTLSFSGAGVPAGLKRGDHVAVWVTSLEKPSSSSTTGQHAESSTGKSDAVDSFGDVVVTDVQRAGDSLAGATGTVVTIALPDERTVSPSGMAQLVQAAKTDNVFLIKVG